MAFQKKPVTDICFPATSHPPGFTPLRIRYERPYIWKSLETCCELRTSLSLFFSWDPCGLAWTVTECDIGTFPLLSHLQPPICGWFWRSLFLIFVCVTLEMHYHWCDLMPPLGCIFKVFATVGQNLSQLPC